MTALRTTLFLSAVVDDRRPNAPGASAQHEALISGHRQLDRVLRSSQAVLARPPADLAYRITERIAAVPHRRETVVAVLLRSPGRMAALAAACLALAACIWVLLPHVGPAESRLSASRGVGLGLDPSVLFRLPEHSEPALRAQIDDPYLQEAAFLRSDTVRAADMVLAHLPLGRR